MAGNQMNLDRLLAETFRAARWAESDGRPVCPYCYDDCDLVVSHSSSDGLCRYWCRACRRSLADVSDTPFARRRAGIVRWALLALASNEALIAFHRIEPRHVRDRDRAVYLTLSESPFAARWKTALGHAGVTTDALKRALRIS